MLQQERNMTEERPHALVIGVGVGTGAACVRRFVDGGYRVSMVARSPERLAEFTAEIPHTTAFPADIADGEPFRATLREIVAAQGHVDVVIYNAAQATFAPYHELDVGKFERNFRVNTSGLLIAAQALAPAMAERGRGAIVVTGNTAALRGKPAFVGFAPTKAAQRILSESLARELGPQGVHVAYVVIDAAIDMPFAKRRFGEREPDFFAQPADLAGEIFHVAHQPRSTWSFLVELRPFGEVW
jgi:short-subunit dehydrogenase